MQTLKKCTKCFDVKELSEFRRQKQNKDGYKYICKECDDEVQRQRYQAKKETCIKTVKEWQGKNHDKVKSYKRFYKQRHSIKFQNNEKRPVSDCPSEG